MEKNTSFRYTYSAALSKEIRQLKEKYLPYMSHRHRSTDQSNSKLPDKTGQSKKEA